jgi:CheY-like chemotaxis protein
MACILIIEDDQITATGLASILETHGHDASTARDAHDALRLLEDGLAPDLVLLDMIVPGGADGWTFLALRPRMPVVIATGLSVASPEWARALGAVALLRKPFTIEALLQAIEEHTQRPQESRRPSAAERLARLTTIRAPRQSESAV